MLRMLDKDRLLLPFVSKANSSRMENLIIQWCRKDQGFTVQDIAGKAHIAEADYSNLEKGITSPSWKQAKDLATHLKLDKELIYYSGQLIDNIRLLQQIVEDFTEQNEKLLKDLSGKGFDKPCSFSADNKEDLEIIENITNKLSLTEITVLLWQLVKPALLKETSSASRAVMIEFYEDTCKLFEAISNIAEARTTSKQQ